jgi:hypothetical protein
MERRKLKEKALRYDSDTYCSKDCEHAFNIWPEELGYWWGNADNYPHEQLYTNYRAWYN